MKKIKTILTIGSAIAIACVANAQEWTAISTFEDAADVDKWTVSTAENNDPTDLPRFILQDDPLTSGQGQVVAINPGVPTTGGLATSFTTPLPFVWETDESLPIGEAQYYTLFYKIHHPNVEGALGKNNATIGTIDADNSTQNEFGFYSWPTYNMIFRDGGVGGDNYPEEDNGLPLNSHNGTTYFMPYASATETEPDGARMPAADAHAQPDVWYNVWMVGNMDDLTAEVYVSGGQFGETARLINIIPNYRNGAAVDHDTILINTSTDGVNFPHSTFFDDVYVTTGKVLSEPGTDPVDPPATGGKFINISTRGTVGVGDDALIGGFVIGEDAQQVVIQAIGQELAGVTGFLVDPVLSIRNSAGDEIGMNDNWQDTQEQLITDLWGGAPPFADGSLSAGGVWTLDPGSYTAIVTGKDDTTGVALIEVYQID